MTAKGADLPQLVKRLHANGIAAIAGFSQGELETIIDDLPLALESEEIRDHLAAVVARIETCQKRAFQRIFEIAQQDEERAGMLLVALRQLRWRGSPTEEQFAWLVQQASRHPDEAIRQAAFEHAAALTLSGAQTSILDRVAVSRVEKDARDDEIVLPNEPLRTLPDYTRFVKALSAGGPIHELLSAHGMNDRAYVACMTAWGRLMLERPDLAERMGELLRAA